MTTTIESTRRVILLDTDERAGLVASIANTCADKGVSLEIATGPGHVIISFAADDATLESLVKTLGSIEGVNEIHPYAVASA